MEARKLFKNVILILTILVFIGGCATTTKFVKEPDESLKTLLIGHIKLTSSNVPPGYELKEVITTGLSIHLENISTGEMIKVYSKGSDGYVFIVNPDTNKYRIVKFSLQYSTTNFRWTGDIPINRNIRIEPGKVNNLGIFDWYYDFDLGQKYDCNIKYEDVKGWFKEKYPESAWNNKEWVNVELY